MFLSSSSGQPANDQRILEVAGRAGCRSIGLAYVNDASVDDQCEGLPEACPGLVRLESLDGTERSTDI